ncbi:ankyrin repeat protein [Cotonvirus japonicus]|uniref:Ankyrin repeat protein n=1 Tax=Cotonvirus japonicus TaxID=2811091 RepID=A0ABM7NRS5_9VIRU|nr:ankyrin repeat protein [Cotonvirus japonicus]BCS82858.1 ankyrin repeat protein [Cotonvirus japonicus]
MYKIINESGNHRGYQYSEYGLNILSDIFVKQDSKKYKPCMENGFYFTDIHHILMYLEYGIYLWRIDLPTEDKDFIMEKDPIDEKYRSNKIILSQKYDLRLKSTFEFLVENGVDIKIDNNRAIRWASKNGFIDIVEYLIEQGANYRVLDNESLYLACENGHINVVNLLLNHGVHPLLSKYLLGAIRCGSLNIVKILISNGADYKFSDNICLRTAILCNHADIIAYLNLLNNKN